MISLTDRTTIPAPPERVWAWFAELDEHYRDWHPEHLMWRTLSGPALKSGTIVFADEWIGGLRLAGRFRIIEARPGQLFRWKMLFPWSLVGVGGSFLLEGSDRVVSSLPKCTWGGQCRSSNHCSTG
jgi:hypothetical protein